MTILIEFGVERTLEFRSCNKTPAPRNRSMHCTNHVTNTCSVYAVLEENIFHIEEMMQNKR